MTKRHDVDVICQFNKDGDIMPIKIRVTDDDGELQEYAIKGYKIIDCDVEAESPDGVHFGPEIRAFECKIIDFGREKYIRLYFQPRTCTWFMTVV